MPSQKPTILTRFNNAKKAALIYKKHLEALRDESIEHFEGDWDMYFVERVQNIFPDLNARELESTSFENFKKQMTNARIQNYKTSKA